MRRHGKGLVGFITAGCVLCALGGVGLAGGFSPQAAAGTPSVTSSHAAREDAGVAQASSAEVAAFPVLGTPDSSSDQAADSDSSFLSSLASGQQDNQANPSLGRLALSTSQAAIVVVPGDGTVCASVSTHVMGTETACNSLAAATLSGLIVGGGVDGTEQLVAGVLPGNVGRSAEIVMASGATTTVAVSAGGGFEYEGTAVPQSVVYSDVSGAQHSIGLGR